MIVLIRLTARRYLAIDAPTQAEAWTSLGRSSTGGTDGVTYARGDIIAGPADIDTIYAAMFEHARAANKLVPIATWEQHQKEHADALKDLNRQLQDSRKTDAPA
jgi:hypothetical protein